MHINRLTMIAAVLLFFCCLYTTAPGGPIAAPQGARPQSSSAPPPPSDRPVEQVRKNIKALQGMPDFQLIPAMQFIDAALGVNCAYCHVREGSEWAFEKDDKKEKQVAREMISMTREINRGSFKGMMEVSCFTCHRGSAHPLSAVPLPVTPAGPPPPRAAGAVPSAADVLKKFEEALGGKAALQKAVSRTARGTVIDGQGNKFPVEVNQKAPDKLVVIVTTPQGTMSRGLEGSRGWVKTAQGVRDPSPGETAHLQRLGDFYWAVKLLERNVNQSIVRKDKVGGRDAYLLRLPLQAGAVELLYFDAETGLLLRRMERTDTLVGPLAEQLDFGDYREVNGIKLPFEIRVNGVDPRGDFTLKYSEVTPDVPLDDSLFRRP